MQLTYNSNPAAGRAGMIADSRTVRHIVSKIADGRVKMGLGVFLVPGYGGPGGSSDLDPGSAYQNPSADQAADVDAIITTATIGAASAGYDYAVGDANGVIGDDVMNPARKLTLVLSNTTNWNATTGVISYIDAALGTIVSENLTIPNNGNTTVTTSGYARSFVSLHIPAQAGAGTFTLGVGQIDASILATDFLGIAVFDPATFETPSDSSSGEILDKDTFAALSIGAAWAETEGTTSDQAAVYVRTGASGSNTQMGKFRADTDGGTAVLVPGAKFLRNQVSGGLNIVQLAY